jgi:hypothetical protein
MVAYLGRVGELRAHARLEGRERAAAKHALAQIEHRGEAGLARRPQHAVAALRAEAGLERGQQHRVDRGRLRRRHAQQLRRAHILVLGGEAARDLEPQHLLGGGRLAYFEALHSASRSPQSF